jgi:hypothetical protein
MASPAAARRRSAQFTFGANQKPISPAIPNEDTDDWAMAWRGTLARGKCSPIRDLLPFINEGIPIDLIDSEIVYVSADQPVELACDVCPTLRDGALR